MKFNDLKPQTVLALFRVDEVYTKFGYEFWITSADDRRHKIGSLHDKGYAFDCRTKTVPRELVVALAETVKVCLGPQFDVLFEDHNGPNEHLHVEYDPT